LPTPVFVGVIMSHPKDLDEYTTDELVNEIKRRTYYFTTCNKCPYCETLLLNSHSPEGEVVCTCKFGKELKKYHDPAALNRLQYGD
jgi:hypothetical protein